MGNDKPACKLFRLLPRTGKPNLERSARYMLYIGIGCLFFSVEGLCSFAAGFQDVGIRGYISFWGFLTGVFSIVSWYGLSRGLPWSFKLSQISVGMLVGALCAKFVEMGFFNAGKLDFSEDKFDLFSGIFVFLIFLQFTVPAVFFLYYLNRLEKLVKNRVISDSIVTNISESKEFPKPEPHVPKIKYRYSRFGAFGEFAPMIAFVASIGIFILMVSGLAIFFSWVIEKVGIAIFFFLILLSIILLAAITLIVIAVRGIRTAERPATPFQKYPMFRRHWDLIARKVKMEKDEAMYGEKSKTKSRQFKISVAIATVQILIFLLAGPAVIGYKLLTRDMENRSVKIMTQAEYLSNRMDINVPCDFYLAEFVFDHNGTLQYGKYYCTLFGKTKTRGYKDGRSFDYGSPYLHMKMFPVVMIVSFGMGLMGAFKKEIGIYGAVMFMTMWGLGIVWIVISVISEYF